MAASGLLVEDRDARSYSVYPALLSVGAANRASSSKLVSRSRSPSDACGTDGSEAIAPVGPLVVAHFAIKERGQRSNVRIVKRQRRRQLSSNSAFQASPELNRHQRVHSHSEEASLERKRIDCIQPQHGGHFAANEIQQVVAPSLRLAAQVV